MKLFAFGLNHETSPVQCREAFALEAEALAPLYERVSLSPQAEFMVLCTCNRTEVYLYGQEEDVPRVADALAAASGHPWPEGSVFLAEDEAAVRHVVQVACGLRSMVLGDGQILSQLKDAYRLASEGGRVGTVLHRLLHSAFRAAKRVSTETSLSRGASSVATLAVDAASAHFAPHAGGRPPLEGRQALLVGAGHMGLLTLRALAAHAPGSLAVVNRSRDRAEEIARETGASVLPWEDRYQAIARADVVVVATGAHDPVLCAEEMLPRPAGLEPALLVDIAMPRNIDPTIGALAGYRLLDLDTLSHALPRAEGSRRSEVPHAEAICEEVLSEFVSWVFHQQALQPAIQTLRETFELIRQQEVERHARRFTEIDRLQLDQITRSIIQKILAVPIVRLKDAAPDSLDLAHRIELLNLLFSRPGCDDAPAPAPTAPARLCPPEVVEPPAGHPAARPPASPAGAA